MSTIKFKEMIQTLKAQNVASDVGINSYRFWDLPIGGESKIRFLPDLDGSNELGFVRERLTHKLVVNGVTKIVPCLKMFSEECPVCKVSRAFYDAQDKASGNRYWRATEYIANVLIINDGIAGGRSGQVMPIQLRPETWELIKVAMIRGELSEYPCDYKLGYDFFIKKRKTGPWPDYKSSGFAPFPSSLDDETIESVKKQLINLNSLIPVNPGVVAIEAMLGMAINGVKAVPVITDDEDDIAKAERILAQLKARRTIE